MAFGLDDFRSLMIGATAAVVVTIYGSIRSRRLNSLGVLVIVEFASSVVLTLVTHNPRVLLFKPAVSLGICGVYLLLTCIFGRPVAYETARRVLSRGDSARGAAYERAWSVSAEVRMRLRIMTAAWGIVFLIDAAVRVYFAVTGSIARAVIAPHLVSAVLIAIAIAIAAAQFRRIKRIV
jgi:intracellular septation protein A